MNKSIIILISVFLVFVLAIAFYVYSTIIINAKKSQENSIVQREEVDILNISENSLNRYLDFAVYRDDGTILELAEYEDSSLVIMLFDDKDDASIENLDSIEALYKNYKNTIKFLMINTNSEVNEELKDKYSFEIFYDLKKESIKKYNISELPYILYINSNNEIFNTKTGLSTQDAISANLDLLSNNI